MPPRLRSDNLHHRLQSPTTAFSSEDHSVSSNFRARLQSLGASEHPHDVSSKPIVQDVPNKVVEQFRADFVFEPSPPSTTAPRPSTKRKRDDETSDPLDGLTEAFTQAGSTIHASIVEKLVEAHAEVEINLTNFFNKSASMLASNEALYSNIVWPLSKTLCRTDARASASVASHLENFDQELQKVEHSLNDLAKEWDNLLLAEEEIWKVLNSEPKQSQYDAEDQGASAAESLADIKAEIREIAKAKSQLIEHIEEEYKEKVQSETAKILQHFMD